MVPMACDGFTLFAVPQTLSTPLAGAEADQLRTTALTWAESVSETVSEMGEGIGPDRAVDLHERPASLARTPAECGRTLYCWYFAP
ncbi:hypothetical protein ACWGBV_19960 [Streptomyces sp. NPDC055051]